MPGTPPHGEIVLGFAAVQCPEAPCVDGFNVEFRFHVSTPRTPDLTGEALEVTLRGPSRDLLGSGTYVAEIPLPPPASSVEFAFSAEFCSDGCADVSMPRNLEFEVVDVAALRWNVLLQNREASCTIEKLYPVIPVETQCERGRCRVASRSNELTSSGTSLLPGDCDFGDEQPLDCEVVIRGPSEFRFQNFVADFVSVVFVGYVPEFIMDPGSCEIYGFPIGVYEVEVSRWPDGAKTTVLVSDPGGTDGRGFSVDLRGCTTAVICSPCPREPLPAICHIEVE
jgi:hypothetical protein